MVPDTLFPSYLWAGYECTTARTEKTFRLDMLRVTQHDIRTREDYALLSDLGIQTVREGFSWSAIDQGNSVFDTSRYIPMLEAGKEAGILQIWDLNHFDFPDYLDPLSERFVLQFGEYAARMADLLLRYIPDELYVVPINEISFFTWICADKGWWAPFKRGRKNGLLFKQQLVRAALHAMDRMWEVNPAIRFIQIDPFMRRINRTPKNKVSAAHVQEFNTIIRFEAWDMLSGKTYPELGGDPKYLDIIGVNYYIHNQEWVSGRGRQLTFERMEWEDPSRISLGEMLRDIYVRYHRPMVLTETGSFGEYRIQWWDRTLRESIAASMNMPLLGICAYPALDRPDTSHFLVAKSGLWDFDQEDPALLRIPHTPTLGVIQSYQSAIHQLQRGA